MGAYLIDRDAAITQRSISILPLLAKGKSTEEKKETILSLYGKVKNHLTFLTTLTIAPTSNKY